MITVQQAAINALVTWISSQTSGIFIDTRWPSPDRQLPPKAITIITAGARKDESFEPHLVKFTNVSTNQSNTRWLIKTCEQPIQLDVWAKTDAERDDILARLDNILNAGETPSGFYNPMPVGDGCICQLVGDWSDTIAAYQFESTLVDDDPDSAARCEFRATINGTIFVQLAVNRITARQATITYKQRVDSSSADISTITSAGVTESTGP